jgi:RNA polymerase sigma-70 factor (ECF subfamily)
VVGVVGVTRSGRAAGRRLRTLLPGNALDAGLGDGLDAVPPEAAFAWFFRAEYPQVVRTVSLVLRDPAAAEDVAQEAFLRLHLHWSKVYRYDRPDAWVRRVALNLAASHARREGRRRALERLSVSSSPAATTHEDTLVDRSAESADRVRVALLTLPHKQRALVVLYYYEDRPLTEAGELLGLTPGSAKVAMHRARRRLAVALGPTASVFDRPDDRGAVDDA